MATPASTRAHTRAHTRRVAHLIGVTTAAAALATSALAAPATAAGGPTITALPASVDAGKAVGVTGKAGKKQKVVVQQRRGKAWVTIGRATSSSTGAWKAAVKFPAGGTFGVRAVAAGKASGSRSIDVFQWLDLATQPFTTGAASAHDVTVRAFNVARPHSIYLFNSTNAITLWKISGRCTTLTYAIGFRDAEAAQADLDETLTTQAAGFRPDGSQDNAATSTPRVADWGAARIRAVTVTNLLASDRLLIAMNVANPANAALSMPILSPRARCRTTALASIDIEDAPPL